MSKLGCSNASMQISSCTFTTSSRQLSIQYLFFSGTSTNQAITLSLAGFKNPVRPGTQSGFTVASLDSNNYSVGISGLVSLNAIATPQQLDFVTVGFDSKAQVGQYSALKVNIGTVQALGYLCYAQVQFPPELTLDGTLTAVEGTGFFTGVSVFRIDVASKIVQVKACTVSYGAAPQLGSLVFKQIKNPSYVTGTGPLYVKLSVDTTFGSLIASFDRGYAIPASFFSPGSIKAISIVPKDPSYGVLTSYDFTFTPSSDLWSTTGTQITIDFPASLSFPQNYCGVIGKSDNVSSSITCSLNSGSQILLNYVFSSKPTFVGGTQIFLSIFGIKNPISQFNMGDFKISTYMKVNTIFSLVDQDVNVTPVMAQNGIVVKTRDITATSYETNAKDVTYTLSMKFAYPIPIGGTIRVSFIDDSTKIGNAQLLSNSCYRLDFSDKPTGLPCKVTLTPVQIIDIAVAAPAFDSSGLKAGVEFRLQISPITNRRDLFSDASFAIQSFDASGNNIDKSPDPTNFTLRMQTVSMFGGFSVSFDNKVNGQLATYKLGFAPKLLPNSKDAIQVSFPPQIGLKSSGPIPCSGDNQYTFELACYLAQTNTVMIILQSFVQPPPGVSFFVYLPNLRNPYSMKPTDPFPKNVTLQDSQGRILASGIEDQITVQTTTASKITGSTLTQSPSDPGVMAYYTLAFNTNNPLPQTAVMQITAPVGVTFQLDSTMCTVQTTTLKSGLCRYNGNTVIQIRNAFADQPDVYSGRVVISFYAYNPADNLQKTPSLKFEIFTDTSFQYLIDIIDNGLSPKTQCNFPCLTCDGINPDKCTSCAKGYTDPQYLQVDPSGKTATCKYSCDQGYTYSTTNGKTCVKCADRCASCDTNGTCTACSPLYPYFWPQKGSCFDSFTKCPIGSYQFSKYVCDSCPENCSSCTSPVNCLKCDPTSALPIRSSGQCVSKCPSGKTQMIVDGILQCMPCQAPCEQCEQGSPTSCTKCISGQSLFRVGSQCLTECPVGMTADMTLMTCSKCPVGCQECDETQPNTCLVCQKGLVFHEGVCKTECPIDMLKSSDGTVCEKRIYPLNKSLMPFPFCFSSMILLCVAIISWLISDKTTLINQTFIVMLASLIQFAMFFEILRAIKEGQKVFIAIPILILIAQSILNVAFALTYHNQIEDFSFDEHKKKHPKLFKTVMAFVIFFNFHVFRLLYSKLFLINGFDGSATYAHQFLQPIKFYSRLYLAVILCPTVLLNLIGAIVMRKVFGENQMQMTMIELCILSLVFTIAIIIEQFLQKPRKMLFKPSAESSLFKGMFAKRRDKLGAVAIDDSADRDKKHHDSDMEGQSTFWKNQERDQRFKDLESVINAVKRMKDKHINENFDRVMDIELAQINAGDFEGRRCDTDFDPKLPLPLNKELDLFYEKAGLSLPSEPAVNMTYPGFNVSYDSNMKRAELARSFEKQAVEDAEDERLFIEQMARYSRYKDQEVMYDAALIDNCFFAAKSKADNVAQTIQYVVDRGHDPMEFFPIDQQSSNVPESEVKDKMPDADDTMASNRPLLKAADNSISSNRPLLIKDTADVGTETERSPVKIYGLDGLVIPALRTQRDVSKSKIVLSRQLSDDEPNIIVTPTSERTKDFKMIWRSAKVQSQTSIDQSESTVLVREPYLRAEKSRPEKQVWLNRADQLKTIILSDIEIKKRQKEPYQGLNLKKELDEEKTEGTIKAELVVRNNNSVDKLKDNSLDLNFRIAPPGELKEEAIYEDHYDQDDALFYKNNFPYDERYEVSSINTEDFPQEVSVAKSFKDDFTAWMKEIVEINQRTFNVFEVLGNFELDKDGCIKDRESTILKNNFLDLDGLLVNEKGYLINEVTGAIRSKFTYEDLFMPEVGSIEDLGELPMPYRLEKFNFNPHRIFGSFNYKPDENQVMRHEILENQHKQLLDNHFRPVNQSGFLINEREDIIDNDGHVRFIKKQLGRNGSLPELYNYAGEKYSIMDISGRFRRDADSKEIILNFDNAKCRALDEDGRMVNAAGYLINEHGSIVNKQGKVIFNFWEVLFNEPPKFFSFTEFSIDWIKGSLNRDVTKNPLHDDETDDQGRRINTMGYLINNQECIVDQHGKEVFKNDLLREMYGQDAEIPALFRKGLLKKPTQVMQTNISWLKQNTADFSDFQRMDSNTSEHSEGEIDVANQKTKAKASAGRKSLVNTLSMSMQSKQKDFDTTKNTDISKFAPIQQQQKRNTKEGKKPPKKKGKK